MPQLSSSGERGLGDPRQELPHLPHSLCMRQGVLHIIHSREAILVPLDTKSSVRTCTFLFSSFASLPGSNPHHPGYFPSRPQSPRVQKHEKDNGKPWRQHSSPGVSCVSISERRNRLILRCHCFLCFVLLSIFLSFLFI